MKLLRIGEIGKEKPAIIDNDNNYKDLSSIVIDFNPDTLNFKTLEKIKQIDVSKLPTLDPKARIGACVSKPSKFIGIGLNFKDHAEEQNLPIPKEPIIFSKFTNCVSGPNDDIIIPKNSNHTDWEVELGIIIGKEAKYINEEQSQDHIAGYCVVNDLSERAFQIERSGQWVKGKSCDTFGPIGPYLVTKDEVEDPQNLKLWLELNGKRMQNGTTQTMVYGVNFLVSYISQFMSLQPGDIISTGTPPGVGMGMKPQLFLKPGDVMELGIEGMGNQKQKTVAA